MQEVTEKALSFRQVKQSIGKEIKRLFFRLIPVLVLLSSATAIFLSIPLLTDCKLPILIVQTKTMKPTYRPGDLLILNNRGISLNIGDNVLIYLKRLNGAPLVHRIIAVTDPGTPEATYLTKGDYYVTDDTTSYESMEWMKRDQIYGKVLFYIPELGRIVTQELTPHVKWGMAGVYLLILFFMDKLSFP